MRVPCFAAFVAVAGMATAHADHDSAKRAEALFQEARQLMKAGRFDEACERFRQAFLIEPAPGTQLNLADCYERKGELANAHMLFLRAADAFAQANQAARAKFARDHADQLAAKLATLDLAIEDPPPIGFALTVGGRTVDAAEATHLFLDPGTTEVIATAPHRVTFDRKLELHVGEHVDLPVTLAPEAPPPEATSPPAPLPAPAVVAPPPPAVVVTAHDDHRGRKIATWMTGGVGVAATGTAIVLGLVARSRYHDQFSNGHCTAMGCDLAGARAANDASDLADRATLIGAAGLALVGTSAILYLTTPSDASGHAVAVVASGRF